MTAVEGAASHDDVDALRRLIRRHRTLAALVCAAALALRLLVPAGYMVSGEGGRIAVTLCPGTVPDMAPGIAPIGAMSMMHHAMPGPDHHRSDMQGHANAPCAFAGLAVPTLGAVDPVLLAMVLAIVAALALLPVVPRRAGRVPHLRPPLRGPPRRR